MRGGIEFMAVLLGISASLWLENNRTERELKSQLNQSLKALKLSIIEDKKSMNQFIENHDELISHFNFIQNEDSIKESSNERLKIAFEQTTIPRSINLDFTIFSSMESSGLIYKIQNDELRNKILKLFQSHYTSLIEIFDYDLENVKKMDNVIINDFIISKQSVMWNLDYKHPSTRRDIVENQIFQNYMAGNKSTKIIMVRIIGRLVEQVDDLITELNKW
tara:strand:- start:364 stop:1023 length:660 start_codon:yes stop_codon:yes gene_type:complete